MLKQKATMRSLLVPAGRAPSARALGNFILVGADWCGTQPSRLSASESASRDGTLTPGRESRRRQQRAECANSKGCMTPRRHEGRMTSCRWWQTGTWNHAEEAHGIVSDENEKSSLGATRSKAPHMVGSKGAPGSTGLFSFFEPVRHQHQN